MGLQRGTGFVDVKQLGRFYKLLLALNVFHTLWFLLQRCTRNQSYHSMQPVTNKHTHTPVCFIQLAHEHHGLLGPLARCHLELLPLAVVIQRVPQLVLGEGLCMCLCGFSCRLAGQCEK